MSNAGPADGFPIALGNRVVGKGGGGVVGGYIPRVPSHGQCSGTFYYIVSRFTSLETSPTTFPLPSNPATSLWSPASHDQLTSLPGSLMTLLVPAP